MFPREMAVHRELLMTQVREGEAWKVAASRGKRTFGREQCGGCGQLWAVKQELPQVSFPEARISNS